MTHHDPTRSDLSGHDLVGRPDCGAPGGISDRFVLAGTDRPQEHRKVGCGTGHGVTVPVEHLQVHAAHAGPEPDRRTLSPALSCRDRAILRAVGDGTAELTVSVAPDLFLDGRCCSDQIAARRLARRGLIAAARPAGSGQRVPARLTRAGRDALAVTVRPLARSGYGFDTG